VEERRPISEGEVRFSEPLCDEPKMVGSDAPALHPQSLAALPGSG
jgi:hypothetical protein